MKPSDHNTSGTAEHHPRPTEPAALPPPAVGMAADPLRGLASASDAAATPTTDCATRASLWSRIKRAFQYGSQGGEDG